MKKEFDYELIRSRRRTIAAEVKAGRLIVRAPLFASAGEIERFIRSNEARITAYLEKARKAEEAKKSVRRLSPGEICDLKKRAARIIPERVKHFASIVGVEYGRVTVRMQKTRWGSCSKSGNLSFNCLLLLAPPEVLDGVVVHELCHRKHMDHSDAFYREVTRVLPDYKTGSKWLKENGGLLLAAAGKDE